MYVLIYNISVLYIEIRVTLIKKNNFITAML